MKKVYILKGLPASGKSTWAKALIDKQPGAYKRISKDDLRSMLDNHHYSQGNEKFILCVRDALILEGLAAGYHVIIDDTNLHPKHIETIRELVKGKALVEIKDFTDVPLEECVERDRRRQNYVGEQVIRKMYNDFLRKEEHVKPLEYLWGASDAIIVDLDGTLALVTDRSPYDTAKCGQDILNKSVANVVETYRQKGAKILLASGRSEEHRAVSSLWLEQNNILYDKLWMRPDGDTRKDAIIKREMYEQHIAGQYNVLFVVDDRSQVVKVWRGLGLTCFQVADGDY